MEEDEKVYEVGEKEDGKKEERKYIEKMIYKNKFRKEGKNLLICVQKKSLVIKGRL